MKLNRIEQIYRGLKNDNETYYIFDYSKNSIIFNILFDIYYSPFKLHFLVVEDNFSFVIDINKGFIISTSLNTEERKSLPLSKGKLLLKILKDKTVYKEEYPLLNDVVSSFLFYANGNEVLTIHFSTETKQLTMYREDELIFAGMSKGKLTKKLIRYLYPNLSTKELYINFFILWEEI